MMFEFDYVGFAPEYRTTHHIDADNLEHAEHRALEYIANTYPELQDVEITASRVL